MEELSKILAEAWESMAKSVDKKTLKNDRLNENVASKAFSKTPLHKNSKIAGNKEGAKNAPSKFEAKKGGMEKTDNKNDQGAINAEDEFEGSKKATGEDGVNREEGASGGEKIAKDYINHKTKKLDESTIEKVKNILRTK